MFSRFYLCEHKGSNKIHELFCESMRGYKFLLISGIDKPNDDYLKFLKNNLNSLEFRWLLNMDVRRLKNSPN